LALVAAPIAGDVVVRRGGRVEGLFGAMAAGTVLDVPAGGAVQSRALAKLGYRVFSIDLFAPQKQDRIAGTSWICADANRALPFRDSAFDYVLSREGIEHLENQMGFLRNCARVLAPGGRIVLTTPNMMHLAARASGFLTGQRSLRRGLINEIQSPRGQKDGHGPAYHGHVFMVDYYRARYMMRVAGFDRLEVYTDRWSPTSVAMAPIVPILWLAMKFSVRASARNARRPGHRATPDDVTREMFRHVLSPALLFGKRMIVVAEKPNL